MRSETKHGYASAIDYPREIGCSKPVSNEILQILLDFFILLIIQYINLLIFFFLKKKNCCIIYHMLHTLYYSETFCDIAINLLLRTEDREV